MTGFKRDWLAMREPYDHAARDPRLVDRFEEWLSAFPDAEIMDLGCGTGSNLRYLTARMKRSRHWRLVDHDGVLLGALKQAEPFDSECHTIVRKDLGDLAGLPFGRVRAVVASALMDLVSAVWFTALAGRCRCAGAALFASLDYDGIMRWQPQLPDDLWINARLNVHQERDKGLGLAMGPAAKPVMCAVLEGLGYRVTTAATPWRLAPSDTAIQIRLVNDIARACLDVHPEAHARIRGWARNRRALIAGKRSRLQVGHHDLLATPREPRGC